MEGSKLIETSQSGKLAGYSITLLDFLDEKHFNFSLKLLSRVAPTEGVPEILNSIENLMGVDKKNILTCDGASQGISLVLLNHIFNWKKKSAKLRAFIPDISFPSYRYLLESFGFEVLTYVHSDILMVLNNCLDECDVVIVNTPHNPTGVSYDVGQVLQLADMSNRLGFTLIVDLAYIAQADNYDLVSFSSVLINFDYVAQVYTFSKLIGLQGLRSGFVIAGSKLVSELILHKRMFSLASSVSDQLIVSAYCEDLVDGCALEKYKNYILTSRLALQSALDAYGYESYKFSNVGSGYILARVPAELSVGVPGNYFGCVPPGFFRLCAANPIADFNVLE